MSDGGYFGDGGRPVRPEAELGEYRCPACGGGGSGCCAYGGGGPVVGGAVARRVVNPPVVLDLGDRVRVNGSGGREGRVVGREGRRFAVEGRSSVSGRVWRVLCLLSEVTLLEVGSGAVTRPVLVPVGGGRFAAQERLL